MLAAALNKEKIMGRSTFLAMQVVKDSRVEAAV